MVVMRMEERVTINKEAVVKRESRLQTNKQKQGSKYRGRTRKSLESAGGNYLIQQNL